MIKVVAFDAYGTIYDVYSVRQKCESYFPGKGEIISRIWRNKQLQYSWMRTMMGNYQDFWAITHAGLQWALEFVGENYDNDLIDNILNEYYHLTPHHDAVEAFETFKPRKLAILSNGAPAMLETVVNNNRHSIHFEAILSVDSKKAYKPYPGIYALALEHFGVEKNEVLFVSANGWDCVGAKNFGYTVGWVNRNNEPLEKLDYKPDFIVRSLLELAQVTKNL